MAHDALGRAGYVPSVSERHRHGLAPGHRSFAAGICDSGGRDGAADEADIRRPSRAIHAHKTTVATYEIFNLVMKLGAGRVASEYARNRSI